MTFKRFHHSRARHPRQSSRKQSVAPTQFILNTETCKHVSASLGSMVILDQREGIHYS
ncbi:hypothetical protein [Fibrobacter succinogenes]|uniref:hypothetical protein n=1 Tax=Fibrobacter succinogenes TaxID=833 RepID=UPI0015684F86|nr:hypothetical protein [Fibrobacter succinogenes]